MTQHARSAGRGSDARGRRRLRATLVLVATCAASGPVWSSQAPMGASDYLEFETVLDGRCQNLSEGGKLIQLRNHHPDRPIRYRLVRYFAAVSQGLSVGEVAPGDGVQKLGCNRVDGRAQRWEIERASFVGD